MAEWHETELGRLRELIWSVERIRTASSTRSLTLAPGGCGPGGDPSPGRQVTPRFLDLDPAGRYLLYGVDGLSVTTRWLDISGKRAPVKVAQFDALSGKETRAYESG